MKLVDESGDKGARTLDVWSIGGVLRGNLIHQHTGDNREEFIFAIAGETGRNGGAERATTLGSCSSATMQRSERVSVKA